MYNVLQILPSIPDRKAAKNCSAPKFQTIIIYFMSKTIINKID